MKQRVLVIICDYLYFTFRSEIFHVLVNYAHWNSRILPLLRCNEILSVYSLIQGATPFSLQWDLKFRQSYPRCHAFLPPFTDASKLSWDLQLIQPGFPRDADAYGERNCRARIAAVHKVYLLSPPHSIYSLFKQDYRLP